MTRRAALSVIGLVIAALVGVALLGIPSSPIHKKTNLGLDLQGGLEVTLQAVPPKDREADDGRPRPLGRDHAEPRRQARRLRARDPQAGRLADRDPAAGRQGPRGRRGDHRQDGAARVLRPRGRPRRRRRSTSARGRRSRRTASTTCSPVSRRSRRRARPTPGTSSTRRRSSSPGPVGKRETALRKYDGKVPDGFRLFGVPEGTVVIRCTTDAQVCPPGVRPDEDAVVPLQVRPARGARR